MERWDRGRKKLFTSTLGWITWDLTLDLVGFGAFMGPLQGLNLSSAWEGYPRGKSEGKTFSNSPWVPGMGMGPLEDPTPPPLTLTLLTLLGLAIKCPTTLLVQVPRQMTLVPLTSERHPWAAILITKQILKIQKLEKLKNWTKLLKKMEKLLKNYWKNH